MRVQPFAHVIAFDLRLSVPTLTRPVPPLLPVASNVNESGSRCCQLNRENRESRDDNS